MSGSSGSTAEGTSPHPRNPEPMIGEETSWQEKIHVGTSGFDYPGWVGPFYPPGTRRKGMLSFYSRQFDTLELNFTFYGIPGPESLARMVRETPPSLGFFVKAHRGITHRREPRKYLSPFLRYLEPARESGRLRGVLLQFPQSFHNTPANREYLRWVARSLAPLPLVLEIRHDCWLGDGLFRLLREWGIAFCCVDEPRLPGLVPPLGIVTAGMAYLRLHSRNGRNWYSGGSRYDYDYSREELLQWADKLRALSRVTTSVYVFFNNCHGAQAARNALLLKELLQQRPLPHPLPAQGSLFS